MIDELNILKSDYENYFGEMEISTKQKKDRVALSQEIDNEIAFILALISLYISSGIANIDREYITNLFAARYEAVVRRYAEIDDYLKNQIQLYCFGFVEVTLNNAIDEYFFSQERIFINATNCASDVLNYEDYVNAIKQGKTHKKWIDIKDSKERKSHIKVGGKEIPIEDYFVVGDSLMRFPHDSTASAKETVNCRCSIRYI